MFSHQDEALSITRRDASLINKKSTNKQDVKLLQTQASLKGAIILGVISFIALLIVARALREIKYYQSQAPAEVLELPRAQFKRIIKEIVIAVLSDVSFNKATWLVKRGDRCTDRTPADRPK